MRIEAGRPVTGYDIDIAANLPKLKKMDLMTSLQKMFNLVFIPSGVPDQIIIEPFDDYFGTGDEVDWTSRVHRDKTISLKPTTDIQAKSTSGHTARGWTLSPTSSRSVLIGSTAHTKSSTLTTTSQRERRR